MSKCYFCGNSVPNDCEKIQIGKLIKKDKEICDICSGNIKCIINSNSTENDYRKSTEYFCALFKKEENVQGEKYINILHRKRSTKQNNKFTKNHGTIYYVDKLPLGRFSDLSRYSEQTVNINIPKLCTCCTGNANSKEIITAKDTEQIGTVKKIRKLSLEFPICEKCLTLRKRKSVKITSFSLNFNTYGLMFTNEEYAKLFAKLNNVKYSEFEDMGLISAMNM